MTRNFLAILVLVASLVPVTTARADFLHCSFYYDYDYSDPYLEVKIVMSGFDKFHDEAYVHNL